MIELADHILGETAQVVPLASAADNRAAAAALAAQARRGLDILTRDLDRPVLDCEPFVTAVRELATRNRHTLIRILVIDATHAVKYGHRLIPLAHRLTSKIRFCNPDETHRNRRESFIIADGRGLLYRKQAERYEGTVDFNAAQQARDLTALFEEMWLGATPDPYIRRLNI